MRKYTLPQSGVYDVASISRAARRRLLVYAGGILLSTLLTVLSCVAVFVWGDNPVVFAASVAAIIVSVLLCIYLSRTIRIGAYNAGEGVVSKVDKEVKSVRGVVGGDIGLFKRRYDHWRSDDIRLGVFITVGDEIILRQLNGISEKQSEYYESSVGEGVIFIPTARFPVRSECRDAYVCPICGEINGQDSKSCTTCGCNVLI